MEGSREDAWGCVGGGGEGSEGWGAGSQWYAHNMSEFSEIRNCVTGFQGPVFHVFLQSKLLSQMNRHVERHGVPLPAGLCVPDGSSDLGAIGTEF